MADLEIIRIDKIKWWIMTSTSNTKIPVPLCPEHNLRMTPVPPRVRRSGTWVNGRTDESTELKCDEGPHFFDMPRTYSDEKTYVLNRIDAKIFKNLKVLNLDDEALPIAKDKASSEDGKFFVTAQIMESKRGKQVVIYAGEKGSKKKTQLFIDPNDKRFSFDHKDMHPSDVFLLVEATFDDGTKSSISRG